MQNQNVTRKRPAELTGELIDKEYALQLITAFKEKFPGEVAELFVETSTVFNAVKNLSNVSGIRFMYGMESADDPASKVILLIPANNTSTHLDIPNSVVQPEGYLNHRGERVSLKRTWQLLYNHAVHYARLQPDFNFRKIVRGAFFGIDSLKSLLLEFTQAHGLHYHFGFDEGIAASPLQHKPVLHPLHTNKAGYEVYMDFGSLCPPTCPPPVKDNPDCAITYTIIGYAPQEEQEREFRICRDYRDSYLLPSTDNGPLVEMYYYVSPALTEAINDTGKADEIYKGVYNDLVRGCNRLIEEKKYEEAKIVFEQVMDDLMRKHLFGKN